MTKYSACPNCGRKATWGRVPIYECSRCGKRFCYECPGSNGARRCPKCQSESKRHVGDAT
jgi:DNA-directed RNA polymerase subunit RPC12/RpoP